MKDRKYTFSRDERIKSNKEISRIINDGIFIFTKHISAQFIKINNADQTYNRIAISVPKKKFKSAVQRNKIKRQIREAYRLNKYLLLEHSFKKNIFYNLIFIFKSNKMPLYKTIEKEILELLLKIRTH